MGRLVFHRFSLHPETDASAASWFVTKHNAHAAADKVDMAKSHPTIVSAVP